jgi:hypothetical protein
MLGAYLAAASKSRVARVVPSLSSILRCCCSIFVMMRAVLRTGAVCIVAASLSKTLLFRYQSSLLYMSMLMGIAIDSVHSSVISLRPGAWKYVSNSVNSRFCRLIHVERRRLCLKCRLGISCWRLRRKTIRVSSKAMCLSFQFLSTLGRVQHLCGTLLLRIPRR